MGYYTMLRKYGKPRRNFLRRFYLYFIGDVFISIIPLALVGYGMALGCMVQGPMYGAFKPLGILCVIINSSHLVITNT